MLGVGKRRGLVFAVIQNIECLLYVSISLQWENVSPVINHDNCYQMGLLLEVPRFARLAVGGRCALMEVLQLWTSLYP